MCMPHREITWKFSSLTYSHLSQQQSDLVQHFLAFKSIYKPIFDSGSCNTKHYGIWAASRYLTSNCLYGGRTHGKIWTKQMQRSPSQVTGRVWTPDFHHQSTDLCYWSIRPLLCYSMQCALESKTIKVIEVLLKFYPACINGAVFW